MNDKGGEAFWVDPGILDPEVAAEVLRIPLVDCHEHLDEESVRLKQPNDLARFFMYYAFDDMASAGLAADVHGRFFKPDTGARGQWNMIREAWPRARHTGYCRALTLSIKRLYGIDDLRDDTIEPLMEAVARGNKPGVLKTILRETCNIDCCLVNAEDPGDLARRTDLPGLFLFDIAVSAFCQDSPDFSAYEKASGIECGSLSACRRMIDFYFRRWGTQAAAVKNVCAYWRTLDFEDVPDERAAPLYEKWMTKKSSVTAAEKKAVQDHLFHYCVKRAVDLDLPVKLHSGYLAGTAYMDMDVFRVRRLDSLFRKYPQARFDVFHIGYPDHGELVAMAKHYPNVYADMCWAWIIDPQASLEFARRALVSMPANKLFGFGGDYGFADVVYGHSRIARDGIALVLTEAVREGRLTRSDAKEVARRWLHDNAYECFRVEKRRAAQAAGQPPALPGGSGG